MIPPMPPNCRRESRRALALSVAPASAVVLALITGFHQIAAWIFGITFIVISVGTVLPRCALFGPLVTRLPAGTKGVCVTIDDGPHPDTTPALLEVLDEHRAKAVFFLIGDRAQQHPDLVREIARRGHLIGNHSQTHPAATFWLLRPWQLWREIATCQETLEGITGQAPTWFRPPVGHHNLFLASILRALGLTMMIWNCRGFDGVRRDVSAILRCIERDLHPGTIVLLHDVNPVCADVLRGTLQHLHDRGLPVVLPAEMSAKAA
jgi:peptidoglycan/xylan/chitin deacetylase (PgdA/CDA1 family)